MHEKHSSSLKDWLPLLPPCLLGAILRLWNLSGQIVGGDELHAVRAAVSRPIGELLFRYETPEFYMPVAVLLRLLSDSGVPITSFWLRLPGLAAGITLVLLLPRLAAPWVGEDRARLFAWLLALCPSLVLYSRIARPYQLMVFLGAVASLAFFAWYKQGQRNKLWLFLGGAVGAVFVHPVAGPAVVAPLGFAALDLMAQRGEARRERLGRCLVAGSSLAALLAGWFWLSRQSLLALIAEKREPARFDGESFAGLALLEAGSGGPLVAILFWALAIAGGWLLLRRHRRFGLFLLVLYLAPVAGLIVLSPVAGHQPLMFHRYTLLAVPPLLLLVAEALTKGIELCRSRLGKAAVMPVVLGLGLWWLLGPLAGFQLRAGTFAHHNDFVAFHCPPARLPREKLPEVYARLLEAPPGAVIELPWQPAWRFTRALHAYQEHHKRRVWVVSGEPALAPPGVRLTGLLPWKETAWLASDARFLVVHLDPSGEERALEVPACGQWMGTMPEDLGRRLAARGQTLADRLRAHWGPPWLETPAHLIWDLDRHRAAADARGR